MHKNNSKSKSTFQVYRKKTVYTSRNKNKVNKIIKISIDINIKPKQSDQLKENSNTFSQGTVTATKGHFAHPSASTTWKLEEVNYNLIKTPEKQNKDIIEQTFKSRNGFLSQSPKRAFLKSY